MTQMVVKIGKREKKKKKEIDMGISLHSMFFFTLIGCITSPLLTTLHTLQIDCDELNKFEEMEIKKV